MQARAFATPRHCLTALALLGALVFWEPSASAHDGLTEQIAGLTAQLAARPDSADLLIRRGELYRQAGQRKQALGDIDRAERLDPALPTPDLIRAHVYFDSRNWTAAVSAASKFLERQPGNADALVIRGRSRVQLGAARAAATDFTRALETRPLPDLYCERARTVAGLGQKGLEDALHGLDEGITRLGPIVTLELEAIDLELRLRRYDAALARLDRVSAQAARQDSWLARRGAVLEQAGRPEQARATYLAALDAINIQPDRVRRTRASLALIERLHADIARLDAATNPALPGLTRKK